MKNKKKNEFESKKTNKLDKVINKFDINQRQINFEIFDNIKDKNIKKYDIIDL